MSNSLREEWAEVCAERDKLREENARLRALLAAAGVDPATGGIADPVLAEAVRMVLDRGEGVHRVAQRTGVSATALLHAVTGEKLRRRASDPPAIPQPATDVQAALADALLLCVKWMPCAEVRSWPPGFRLRKEALAAADAALLLAGRKS